MVCGVLAFSLKASPHREIFHNLLQDPLFLGVGCPLNRLDWAIYDFAERRKDSWARFSRNLPLANVMEWPVSSLKSLYVSSLG